MTSPAVYAGGLLGNAIVDGVTGWTLRYGKMVSTPNRVVVLTDSGGQSPNPRWKIDYPTFQARVRGGNGEYAEAYDKAKEVRNKLLGIDSQDLAGGDRLVSIICVGDIGFMGYDENDRPEFSVNFRAIIEPVTAEPNRESL